MTFNMFNDNDRNNGAGVFAVRPKVSYFAAIEDDIMFSNGLPSIDMHVEEYRTSTVNRY